MLILKFKVMKKLRISLMLLLVVLVSGSTMAMGKLKVEVVTGEKNKALVDVLVAPESRFSVDVKDKNGEIVYTDREEALSYNSKKVYDFSNLENGTYTFEVHLGNETDVSRMIVDNDKIKIIRQNELLAPEFSLNGRFLKISFPNSTQENVRVLLYSNDNQHWVFQEELSPEFDLKQALNLSKLQPGDYKAVLIVDDETYNYEFHLS